MNYEEKIWQNLKSINNLQACKGGNSVKKIFTSSWIEEENFLSTIVEEIWDNLHLGRSWDTREPSTCIFMLYHIEKFWQYIHKSLIIWLYCFTFWPIGSLFQVVEQFIMSTWDHEFNPKLLQYFRRIFKPRSCLNNDSSCPLFLGDSI